MPLTNARQRLLGQQTNSPFPANVTTQLFDGVTADVVRVTYKPGAGSAAGLHTWYYYLDHKTGRLLANTLKDKDVFTASSQYARFSQVGGLLLPSERYGYSVDAIGMPVRRVSVIVQQNMVFDKAIPAANFQLPHHADQASR